MTLSGLSAFTFGGAKVITAQKTQTDPKSVITEANILTDLVQNDKKEADLGDFQMILITFSAVVIFLASAFHFLGELRIAKTVELPDIDTTLLSGFALGQGAYLFKKAALKSGEG